MKNIKIIALFFVLIGLLASCQDDDDQFLGTPVGTQNIVTLRGTLTTDIDFALTDQDVDFTVTLPRTFADTVSVEVTTISDSGRRVRELIEFQPNEASKEGTIRAAGGAIFDTSFKMYISGISLQTPDPVGTHYLMESDVITIGTGSGTIPDQDPAKLIVRLVWPSASAVANNLQLTVDRPISADVNVTLFNGAGKQHLINVVNVGSNNANLSTEPGEYVFKIKALTLQTAPVDLPYRVIVVSPNGDAKVFSGTLNGLTIDTPLVDVLKVVKSDTGDFVLTDLTN